MLTHEIAEKLYALGLSRRTIFELMQLPDLWKRSRTFCEETRRLHTQNKRHPFRATLRAWLGMVDLQSHIFREMLGGGKEDLEFMEMLARWLKIYELREHVQRFLPTTVTGPIVDHAQLPYLDLLLSVYGRAWAHISETQRTEALVRYLTELASEQRELPNSHPALNEDFVAWHKTSHPAYVPPTWPTDGRVERLLERALQKLKPERAALARHRHGIGVSPGTRAELKARIANKNVPVQSALDNAYRPFQYLSVAHHLRFLLVNTPDVDWMRRLDEALHADDPVEDSSWMFLTHLAKSVEELELSVHTANALQNKNIGHVWQLVQHTPKQVLTWKGVGKKSLAELQAILHSMDLDFGLTLTEGQIQALDETCAHRA